jgi:hypothetical protein
MTSTTRERAHPPTTSLIAADLRRLRCTSMGDIGERTKEVEAPAPVDVPAPDREPVPVPVPARVPS